MTFKNREAFDLLFPRDGDEHRRAWEARRWFRSPALDSFQDMPRNEELQDADRILAARIDEALPAWLDRAGGEPTGSKPDADRRLPPRLPYDVFAAAAYVIEAAGIYHHIQPSKVPAAALHHPFDDRHLEITHADRKLVADVADAWAHLDVLNLTPFDAAQKLVAPATWARMEPLFESWWHVFERSADEPVLADPGGTRAPHAPSWWKHAWRLFAVADSAAKGTVFMFDVDEMRRAISGTKSKVRWFEFQVMMEHIQRSLAATLASEGDAAGDVSEFADLTTLSIARRDIVSVLPKVRTSSVGCTLRSLSHHLALLPGAGVARGRWTPHYTKQSEPSDDTPSGTMNLVLIPLPYSLTAASFRKTVVEEVDGEGDDCSARFGYFEVNQHWIDEDPARTAELISFVQDVIEAAQRETSSIDGIVFPELSLDYATHAAVRDHMRRHLPNAQILVSGTSSNSEGRSGNFVAVTSFQQAPSGGGRIYQETVREKHHRWKLERSQLRDYGLLGVLSPEMDWWENISLQSRKIDFTVMREDSVFAAMICEDLARVDPCQQVIRAVGPNLVIALLMDAPQIAARWPARYATVLAEDPGCACLTLTSRGLMTRQHRLGTHRSNGDDRVVGMWRDDNDTAPVPLKCPYDSQAVLLTIVEDRSEDISLDGRTDCDAKSWRYVGSVPLRIPDAKSRHAQILGQEDMACW